MFYNLFRAYFYMQKMQSLREEDPPAQKKPDPGVLQLKADNTALVIIDVQERSDNWKEWRDETKNIKTLIEKCRTRNLPIIVLSLNFDGIKAIPRESGIGVKEYDQYFQNSFFHSQIPS